MNSKRKKVSRMRGSHTHGRGFKKKARGSGHRGGFGMAGTGKRADQKKSKIIQLDEKYFGKKGLNKKKDKYKIINLSELNKIDKTEIDLKGYKLLAKGEIKNPIKIKVDYASEAAIAKIKKSGGEVILNKKQEE
jgi:large subunit ribosomal protein L15